MHNMMQYELYLRIVHLSQLVMYSLSFPNCTYICTVYTVGPLLLIPPVAPIYSLSDVSP